MSMNELESKVANLRELRRMAEELEAEITATTDELKAYMQANSAEELMGPTSTSPGNPSPPPAWTARP